MFDRSCLPAADYEFVVIADTHYMLDVAGQQVEFGNRRLQSARAAHALARIQALAVPLVIHMGDLIQEFPERPDFAQARDEALAQVAAADLQPRFVAGNHDVGDKPDPTMPASWVTPEFLADYHQRFGRSWYSWDAGPLHFIVLNSQIMNSDLPEAAEQAAWLEADLAANAAKRIVLCLHLPPFLCRADEPALGHYDNIGEPARGWLLALVERHGIELLFAAHVHWAYYNPVGTTRYHTVPSVAFTRPGFSQLFSSAPPAQQGRDDVGKLGFFLVRVHANESRVHFIRTGGITADRPADRPVGSPSTVTSATLLTGTTADLPHSPLGLIARHPLAPTAEVPSSWPSTIRQPVRNDYGFLSLLELGAQHLHVPMSDLVDPVQRERLAWLRDHGVKLTAQWLYENNKPPTDQIMPHLEQIDGIELALLGAPETTSAMLQDAARIEQTTDRPVTLSCVVPGHQVAGKQHNRFQIGYRPEQLATLDGALAQQGLQLQRVACRLDGPTDQLVATLRSVPKLAQIGAIDWRFAIPAGAETYQLGAVAAALAGLMQRPGDRLFFEPFITLDRTMDVGPGLLDRAYNPTPIFHLVRHLNTLLYHQPPAPACTVEVTETARSLQLRWQGKAQQHLLVQPTTTAPLTTDDLPAMAGRRINLVSGEGQPWPSDAVPPITEPQLFYGTIESTQ